MSAPILEELTARLMLRHRSSLTVAEKPEYAGSILDMPYDQGFNNARLSIMPRLPSSTVANIAKGAKAGNTDDMLTLSMMYGIGLGVPRDSDLSMAWAGMSLVQVTTISYKKAVKQLNQHMQSLPKDFCYPELVDRIYKRMLPNYKRVSASELPDDSYLLTPLINGLRAFLIYRVADTEKGKHCYLYDMRVLAAGGTRISLDLATKLNIPRVLGEIQKSFTQADYPDTMKDYLSGPPRYFVVGGTLAIPASKKGLARKAFPDAKSVSDVFDKFVSTADDVRVPFKGTKEYIEAAAELDSAESKLKSVEDGSELEKLRIAFKRARRAFDRAKARKRKSESEELRVELRTMLHRRDSLKNGTALAEAKKVCRTLKSTLSELELRESQLEMEHSAQYPENLFRFIASDLFYGEDKLKRVPIGQYVYQHLSSLGFSTWTHPMLDSLRTLVSRDSKPFSKKTLARAVEKMSEAYSEYSVYGVLARPMNCEHVNSKKANQVYLVTA